MPIYFYEPAKLPCKLCGVGFEHRAGAKESPLTDCPTCGQSVFRKSMQKTVSPKLIAPLSVSSAKQAGFTVLKRVSSGEYEKQ